MEKYILSFKKDFPLNDILDYKVSGNEVMVKSYYNNNNCLVITIKNPKQND